LGREQIDRLVTLQKKKVDQLQTQITTTNLNKSTYYNDNNAAVAENNALGKTIIALAFT
jgi:hypothetical protein